VSTILDALKKVERERKSPREQLLAVPEPEPRRRRVSTAMIAACAALGFAVGAGFALWRSRSPVEVAVAPEATSPEEAPAAELPAGGQERGSAGDEVEVARPEAMPPIEEPTGPGGAEPEMLAGITGGSDRAREPSPFAAPRAAQAEAPRGPAQAVPARPASEPAPVPEEESGAMDGIEESGDLAAIPRAEPAESELVPRQHDELSPEGEEPIIDTGRSPPGAPKVALSFLQWSADPARRFAFISVDGAPSQRVREGDATGSLTVTQIMPGAVQLRHAGTLFTIRPRH
jgi:hypothetical protein